MNIDSSNYYLNAYAASATYQASNFSISGSYLEITGGTSVSGVDSADKAEVSDTANKLLERIRDLDIFKIIFPNSDPRSDTKSLDEVEDDFQKDFFDFSSSFGKMAELMGMSGQGFTMGLNGVGGMTVSGDDAGMASKLQNMFNAPGSQTTVARFAVMAARAALVDAKTSVPGFDQAYSQDPVAAIKDNIGSLKDLLLGFRTQASDGNMNYGFMRDFKLKIASLSASYKTTTADEAKAAEDAQAEDAVSEETEAA